MREHKHVLYFKTEWYGLAAIVFMACRCHIHHIWIIISKKRYYIVIKTSAAAI